MLMRSWQPFTEIETIRQQLDKAFDRRAAARDNSEAAWMPALELVDAGDSFVLKAQLPGIDPKDVDVQVTREAISISGERRWENAGEKPGSVRSEFRYGKFHRVLSLPAHIQNDSVQAECFDGILTLTLPKVSEDRNKVVKINLAEIAGTPATPALEQANQ
ncbi:heat shock protein Hsp20 (plasmid) [Oscillatoria nigro-viridis PCC 7112]|uniref:Heat shock protein Hsp20 n=1 Tax=Phormidium nigroviride PCC 7112 TaxID=179408 RepID=K9VS88_9CYAN|nr:Hsp20/alpha crystallin family protein [Oscillatoria nigro-viridis]AFZ10806.1 heat shock protein Hsp20 [Oscillatoria nigro-viridis PCC 7112]